METAASLASNRYLTFRVGSELYALPTTAVTEVIRLSAVARVPQGPKALLGIANLRGSVVPVVGLRELLRQDAAADLTEKLALVLDQATPTALVVDSIDALEDVTADRIESGHGAGETQSTEKLLGAFKIDRIQQVAKILDIDSLLKSAFAHLAREQPREHKERAIARSAAHKRQAVEREMLVTFDVAGQEFALPLAVVEEILPAPSSVTTISRTDSVSIGFTAVRDTLIPLLSLRGLLGFDAQLGPTEREKVVVLNVGGSPIGLIADAARSVVAAEVDAMEAVPPVLAARTGGEARIRAVYRGDAGRRLISVLSPDHLFREDVMQRLAAIQPTEHKRAAPAKGAAQELIFLVFRLGDDEFGLPIDSVVEVAQVPAKIARLPKAPKFIDGVVNLRGDVLPVVDQRRRFDMPKLDQAEGRRLVVLTTEQHRAGIIVDSVSEVLRTSSDAVSPAPQLTANISRLVHGVINLAESRRLVLLLDPTELLTRAEQGQLDTFQTQSKKVRV